jgi:cystathionine beta-lyase/cystathionine gamma-synthase
LKLVGGVMGVWQGHEIMRGLKTLALRVERSCDNARELAKRLAEDERIARIHFPGMVGEPAVVKRILREPYAGPLVSIELRDNRREAAFRFMDALDLCVRSASLGDIFTSVLHPATSSHRDMSPGRRAELGISDGLIRISVGIENVKDIIADIKQALEAVSAPGAAA